jgi:hypothetical protein
VPLLPRSVADASLQEILYVRKLASLFAISVACSLLWAADWPTDGGNSKRDGWQRDEKILSVDSVKDMKLLWKLKLNNEPREMHSLFPAMIADKVKTASGTKQIAIQAGSSDNLYGIDVATGALLWSKHFPYKSEKPQQPGRGPLCPGGLTATPVIAPATASGERTVYAASSDGMLHQINVADGEETASPERESLCVEFPRQRDLQYDGAGLRRQ